MSAFIGVAAVELSGVLGDASAVAAGNAVALHPLLHEASAAMRPNTATQIYRLCQKLGRIKLYTEFENVIPRS